MVTKQLNGNGSILLNLAVWVINLLVVVLISVVAWNVNSISVLVNNTVKSMHQLEIELSKLKQSADDNRVWLKERLNRMEDAINVSSEHTDLLHRRLDAMDQRHSRKLEKENQPRHRQSYGKEMFNK